MSHLKHRLLKFFHIIKAHPYISSAVGLVVITAAIWGTTHKTPSQEAIKVTRKTITQEVTVTGKTKPAQDVSLAFDRGGRVVRIATQVGESVVPGQVLAQTDASDLFAQLKEARGALASQQAKLEDLQKGTRPEDIAIKEAELNKANQTLQNYYANVNDTIQDAYNKAEDSVRKQTYDMFTGADESNLQLSFSTNNGQAKTDAENQRAIASQTLTIWKNELPAIAATSDHQTLEEALAKAILRLNIFRTFINRLSDALLAQTTISSATTVSTYKGYITTARTNLNTALSSVNELSQSIASQRITVAQATSQLALTKAGATPESIKAQAALVTQAQGNVDSIEAQIGKTIIRSPIAGVVTVQNAKLGEIAASGNSLISVISSSNLQIESNVPEVDIGKIVVGNEVNITLDAFANEKFKGHVVAIDPAETIVDGVVNYKITVAFDQKEERVKSGLTANLSIVTRTKESALTLPQYAIIENDQGNFVRTVEKNGTTKEAPVTIGIRSIDGTVEITSGVEEGQEVANIGAKTK